ncbi:AbrB/MazE/SpoVT family DNA-binding domain-containing protein [Candidatus Gottesmanbacteria bacterium]|nr:AbrB/MazE/SpoVT family DNA-binding domain-containing protein [Candidatus Gottesmanbacteria bacterium]
MHQKVVKSGTYSLGVTIPARFVHALGIKAGDSVMVEANVDTGIIRLKFSGAVQLRLPSSKQAS